MFVAAGGAVAAHWEAVRDALVRPVQVPLWAALLIGFGVALLLAMAWRTRRDRGGDVGEAHVQPNAVPIVPVDVPDEEINMQQAFHLVSERMGLALGGGRAEALFAVFGELRQKARDGDIVIRGRQQQLTSVLGMYRPREAIPPEPWRTIGFDASRYILGQSEDFIRETPTQPDFDKDRRNPEPYVDLVVSRRAIEKFWPRS